MSGVLDLVLPTLIVPTCEYVILRRIRPGSRPLAARLAAWVCLWVGQLSLLMLWVGVEAADYVYYWVVLRQFGYAIVYGAGALVAAVYLALLGLRVFELGTIALGRATEDALATKATALLPRALVMGLVAGAYFVLLGVFPIRGDGWTQGWYRAFVLYPITLMAGLVSVVAFALRTPPWRVRTGR